MPVFDLRFSFAGPYFRERRCLAAYADKERLLIETVRHKTKMPLDLYREVIGNFRKIVHILYPAKMQDYIEMFPKKNVIFQTIKNEVF